MLIKKSLLKALTKRATDHKRKVIDDSDEEINDSYVAELRDKLGLTEGSDSSSDNNNDSSEKVEPYSLYPVSLPEPVSASTKKQKQLHYTAEVIVEITNREGTRVPVSALLDTGCTSTIVLKDYVRRGAASSKASKGQEWRTLGGKFVTTKQALIDIKFPELDSQKVVTWVAHVDETTEAKTSPYAMIIGMDMLTEIGLVVNTATKTIDWFEASTPMKQRGQLHEAHYVDMCYHMAMETKTLQLAEEQQKRILDADYSKVDMHEYVEELTHLSTTEKKSLNHVLQSHPTLFGGGLGELDIKPVSLEVKEEAVPYHAKASRYLAIVENRLRSKNSINYMRENASHLSLLVS